MKIGGTKSKKSLVEDKIIKKLDVEKEVATLMQRFFVKKKQQNEPQTLKSV